MHSAAPAIGVMCVVNGYCITRRKYCWRSVESERVRQNSIPAVVSIKLGVHHSPSKSGFDPSELEHRSSMGKKGFLSCLCRPRHPDETGVLSSKITVAATPSPSLQSKRRDTANFTDDFAASPFTPEDNSWFRNDDTEPTVEEEEEETFEGAYRFWHSKGLLSFVPESIQKEQRLKRAENEWATFPSASKDPFGSTTVHQQTAKQKKSLPKPLRIPPPLASPVETTRKSPTVAKKLDSTTYSTPDKKWGRTVSTMPKARATLNHTSNPPSSRRALSEPEPEQNINERRDLKLRSHSQTRTNSLLPPPRNKQEECASCGSEIVTRVRCVQCKQTVYCSMFCRGNDRYKHGSICSKKYCESTTTGSPKTPNKEQASPRHEATSWKKRVSLDEDPQPEAQALRRYWEDRSNLEYNDL